MTEYEEGGAMYIPSAHREDRLPVLHDWIRQYNFATLVSGTVDGLVASHLPLLLDAERGPQGTLIGHLARANPHAEALRSDGEALAIFHGPHAYVSPTWYTVPMAVPTWNYVAVHAYGQPRLIEDEERLYGMVEALVHYHEAQFAYAWDLAARRDYAQKLLKNIVGFEMPISRLEGKAKLSQNRSRADREGVIAGLTAQAEPSGLAVAARMHEGLGPVSPP
jgi:transcriptional regulator